MTKEPWFPTIYLDKCDRCNGTYKCVKFCPHGVLGVREDDVSVINPLGCIYGCSACADLCPKDAIIFPRRGTISRSIKKKSLLQRVICEGCGKKFLSDREIKHCFTCEKTLRTKLTGRK
jgi:NAD-dependent dihydropyrimidine dehydrogenase PreA subunit